MAMDKVEAAYRRAVPPRINGALRLSARLGDGIIRIKPTGWQSAVSVAGQNTQDERKPFLHLVRCHLLPAAIEPASKVADRLEFRHQRAPIPRILAREVFAGKGA